MKLTLVVLGLLAFVVFAMAEDFVESIRFPPIVFPDDDTPKRRLNSIVFPDDGTTTTKRPRTTKAPRTTPKPTKLRPIVFPE